MARSFRELQEGMDPAARARTRERVRTELHRMALDELRNARQLTQAEMAELLDVPQSSISRIERRADMYLSTLRNYIQAMGGILQIQAMFPDGGTVVIDRLGDYNNDTYTVWARSDDRQTYRLFARPLQHAGKALFTKPLGLSGFTKSMRALGVPEGAIRSIRGRLVGGKEVQVVGDSSDTTLTLHASELVAAGFDTEDRED